MPPITVRRPIGLSDNTPVLEGEVGVDQKGRITNLTRAEFFVHLNQLVTQRDGEWCGIPVPLPGGALVLEDRHPLKEQIAELQRITDIDCDEAPTKAPITVDFKIVNTWFTHAYRGNISGIVYVLRHHDGRTSHTFVPDKPRRNAFLFGPFETLDAWHLDTELTAMERLASLISERMFSAYVMTGQFLETSKRSGLTYFFRRLRPTIVLTRGRHRQYFDPHDDDDPDQMRILTTLCLHPLAYYAGTRCGAMVPTDDVIAHLLMMRGDEPLFWKRANHHAPLTAESGLW